MSPKELTKEEQERLHHVKTMIVNEVDKPFTIKQLARRAALGEQRFKDGFSQLFGMSAGAYILATKMQTARFLLTHTERTMKEIAALCGYKRYKNFLKAYKKHFGVTPGSQRKLQLRRTINCFILIGYLINLFRV
jgi:transcriptional regulator GlxA family with amidase domain